MTGHRNLCVFIAVLLAFVLFFSVLFLLLEADHDCAGEDCPVCTLVSLCKDLLRQLLPGLTGTASVIVLPGVFRSEHSGSLSSVPLPTPVSRKVKLSN